jgi:hypothetical protein
MLKPIAQPGTVRQIEYQLIQLVKLPHPTCTHVYFDFFGTRFFGLGPDRPDGSASSPWHTAKHL